MTATNAELEHHRLWRGLAVAMSSSVVVAGILLLANPSPVLGERATSTTSEQLSDGDRTLSITGVRKFRKRLARPIKLGVSGSNAGDLFIEDGFAYCSSGTLGGLVLKKGVPHILSNNHVLALQNAAKKGDPITQPGLVDNNCSDEEANHVAHLSAYKKLRFGGVKRNKVDAALAEIVPGTVDPEGRIQGIGLPGDTVMKPFLGMQVKKAGRSSGLTRGTVILLDATFVIDFGTEENPKSGKFVHQLMVLPNKRTFVEPGDSGSVVFFDRKDCPEWVGLLFAGSAHGWGVVNPIKQVFRTLKKLKPRGRVTPVGCHSAPTPEPTLAPIEASMLQGAGTMDAESQQIEHQLRVGRRIVERRDDEVLALDGVVGLGVGLDQPESGTVALYVLVDDTRPEILERVPAMIDDMPTRIVKTGRFRAFQE